GIVAPPTLPTFIRPRAPDRTEHISAEYPRTKIDKALCRHLVIDAGFTIRFSVHLAPDARVKERVHQLKTMNANRVLQILVWSSPVTVYGNREVTDAYFGHYLPQRLALRDHAHLSVCLHQSSTTSDKLKEALI